MSDTVEYTDILYGKITLPAWTEEFFAAPEMQRLHDVRISIPAGMLRTSGCASRLDHSRGVAYLAYLLGQQQDFDYYSSELTVAALLHDAGHAPFSHVGEPYMREVLGCDHEQRGVALLKQRVSPVLRAALEGCGASVQDAIGILHGEHGYYAGALNGCLDIDNLDNTPRYGLTMGLLRHNELAYDPHELVQLFRRHESRIALHASAAPLIEGWYACREQVYGFIYSDAHMLPEALLSRALYLAMRQGLLTADFFQFTDGQAIEYLRSSASPAVQELMHAALRHACYSLAAVHPCPHLPALKRQALADHLACESCLQLQAVAAASASHRRLKRCTLPLVTDTGALIPAPEPPPSPDALLRVYVRSDVPASAREQIAGETAVWIHRECG